MLFVRASVITFCGYLKSIRKYFYRVHLNFSFPESIHLMYFLSILIFGRAQHFAEFTSIWGRLESIIVQHCNIAHKVKTLNCHNSESFCPFGLIFSHEVGNNVIIQMLYQTKLKYDWMLSY